MTLDIDTHAEKEKRDVALVVAIPDEINHVSN
jgi:hypothetical protein